MIYGPDRQRSDKSQVVTEAQQQHDKIFFSEIICTVETFLIRPVCIKKLHNVLKMVISHKYGKFCHNLLTLTFLFIQCKSMGSTQESHKGL